MSAARMTRWHPSTLERPPAWITSRPLVQGQRSPFFNLGIGIPVPNKEQQGLDYETFLFVYHGNRTRREIRASQMDAVAIGGDELESVCGTVAPYFLAKSTC